jgi:hypothetical protein
MRVGEDLLSVFSVLLGERYMENCKCYDRNGVQCIPSVQNSGPGMLFRNLTHPFCCCCVDVLPGICFSLRCCWKEYIID